MIFTKNDTSTSDEQVEKLTREIKIHYRYCIGSLVDLLSTRVYLSFSVPRLEKFSENTDKLHFEVSVHILKYIRDNNTLKLKYYANMNDAPVYDLLIQASIKTENNLMSFSDYSWQDCLDTGRSTGAYTIFYQGGLIDHGKHVTGLFAQSSAEIEYNAACTSGMALAHFRILIHGFLNKDPEIFPEEAPIIFLDSKSAICMANNGKDTKHTRNIASRMDFVRNVEKCKMHKIDWREGGLKLANIATNNVGENDLTPRIRYIMVILDS